MVLYVSNMGKTYRKLKPHSKPKNKHKMVEEEEYNKKYTKFKYKDWEE